jgi:DNA (cytosine-5)-methyltransferase 1
MENVRLLTSMKTSDGKFVLEHIYKEFDAVGYEVKHFEINTKDYGIPQHRERVIFVAVRKDLKLLPSIPFPTHGQAIDLFTILEPYRTFADACSDLEYLESGEKSKTDALHEAVKHPDHVIKWLWDVPQGKSAHENNDPNLRPPSGYNTTYKRQIWNEPASTVQTTFGMISGCRNVHPIATRSLTIREAARIQSFPDSFEFIGSQGKIRTCIGNAVPPLLAHAIAKHIKEQMLNFVEVSRL